MILNLKNRVYIIEFGLNALMHLQDLINTTEDISEKLLYYGLIKFQPHISKDEIPLMLLDVSKEQIIQMKKMLNENPILSSEKISELYQQMVGEVGIQPSDFYNMTFKEIQDAYNGYLKRKELEANLIVTAINQAQAKNSELIKITEDKGYEIGSLNEREETFHNLGIGV